MAAGKPGDIREARPMLCVGQKPMIKRICDTLDQLRIWPLVVVTGYRADIIERCLADTKAIIVRNRHYAQTDMLASLKLGVAALKDKCDRVFVFPADLPLVKAETLSKLTSSSAQVVRPEYAGKAGHPLLISRSLFPALEVYQGEGGLRALLESLGAEICPVPVDDEAVLLDANSYEEYENLIRLEEQRKGKGRLHARCELQLMVDELVMDGDTMRLMEMLRYTGSLQLASELLRVPYTRSWRQIKNLESQLGITIVRSSAGGVKGGGSQLTEQGQLLLEAYQKMRGECIRMSNWMFQEYFPEDFVEKLQKMD